MNKKEVKKLSDLARIKISKKEIEQFTKQLGDILSYVNKVQGYEFKAKKYNFSEKKAELRKDKVFNYEEKENIIKQFSDKSGKLLKVKKIL